MKEVGYPKADFIDIYNRSYRLAAAVFMISNLIDKDEGLKDKIKNLSLELVSLSVNLKDTNLIESQRIVSNIEKNSLELMSMLDIASVAGLISKMNGDIIKEEFQAFLSFLDKFKQGFEQNKNVSVKSLFEGSLLAAAESGSPTGDSRVADLDPGDKKELKAAEPNGSKVRNGMKRKDLRKNMILDFIKGHHNTSIKDIVPNVTGCSEKTIQRELMNLIKEGKIKKTGERRWSRYSAV